MKAQSDPSVDRARLDRRVESLNTLIQSHAGGLQVVGLAADGCVTVRYTGMCAGCDYRPLTTAGTVKPALLDVQGVTRVRVLGARVSDEATRSIESVMGSSGAAQRAVRLVRQMESADCEAHRIDTEETP